MKKSSLAVLATLAALPVAVIVSTAINTSVPAARTSAVALANLAADNDSGASITVTVPKDNITYNNALILWTGITNAGGYEVTIQHNKYVADTATVPSGLHYTAKNLQPGVTYTVIVEPLNNPALAGTQTFTTPAFPVSNGPGN